MRVLIFSPYSLHPPHFATDLDIAQTHMSAGDEVTLLRCRSSMLACDFTLNHHVPTCLRCVCRHGNGLRSLSGRVTMRTLFELTDADRRELASLPRRFRDADELRQFRVEGFDAGLAVLSSLISQVREPRPDMERHREDVYRMLVTMVGVYRSVQNIVRTQRIERVYAFNGRFAPLRAALRACQSLGVAIRLHELGSSADRYGLFSQMPHNYEYLAQCIREAWAGADPGARSAIAGRFYEERAQGVFRQGYAVTADQKPGMLPEGWDPSKRNIALFIVSSDEWEAAEDTWMTIYPSQEAGIQQIADSLREDQRLHLFVRVHPLLKGIRNSQTDAIARLEGPNLTVIPAESPVSSYCLMQASEKVVTFGSTLGIESVYWRRPSILVSDSAYRRLGGTYVPHDHAETLRMIRGSLAPTEPEPALQYSYYLCTYGEPYRWYTPEGRFRGRFKGNPLGESLLVRAVARVLRSRGLAPLERTLSRLLERSPLRQLGVKAV